jgi:hypothetical protein
MSSACTTVVSMPRARCESTFARTRASPSPRSIHRKPVLVKPHSPPTRWAQSVKYGNDAQASFVSARRS